MRIAPPDNVIPAYTLPQSVPVVPLSPEDSKSLIDGGIFNHDPRGVVFAAGGPAAARLGATIDAAASVHLPGGVRLQPHTAPSRESLLTVLREVGEQGLPYLEQAEVPVADGVALLLAAPDVLKALTNRSQKRNEKIVVLGTNAVRLLKAANEVMHVPHADIPLEVAATLFKAGQQVFITAASTPSPIR